MISAIIVALWSCTLLDFIKPTPGVSVDTELVVGDKKQEVATGAVVGKRQTTTTTNTAETIQQTFNTIDQGKSIWEQLLQMLVAFMVGWLAMPSARQMCIMVRNMLNRSSGE